MPAEHSNWRGVPQDTLPSQQKSSHNREQQVQEHYLKNKNWAVVQITQCLGCSYLQKLQSECPHQMSRSGIQCDGSRLATGGQHTNQPRNMNCSSILPPVLKCLSVFLIGLSVGVGVEGAICQEERVLPERKNIFLNAPCWVFGLQG